MMQKKQEATPQIMNTQHSTQTSKQVNPQTGFPRWKILLMTTIFQLLVSACSQDDSANNGEKTYVIKFPHVTAPATPKGQGAEKMRQLVDERLGGRLKIEVYPSSQLMNDDDSLEALAFGEVQMIAVSLSKFDRLTPRFQVFDLPFLFADLQDVEGFLSSDTGLELLNTLDSKGFHGLAIWHNGMKQFGGPVAMNRPSDAAGLKFRIMESDVLQAQILAMDAVPQKMAFGEVYQALQSGAIDAQENTWSNTWSQKFFEVQPYLTESNHGYLGYFVAVNTDFWNSLPEDIRTELEAIVAEVTAEVNQQAQAINLEHLEKIMETGKSELIKLSEEDIEVWRTVMRPVWDQFADDIGADIMQATAASKSQ